MQKELASEKRIHQANPCFIPQIVEAAISHLSMLNVKYNCESVVCSNFNMIIKFKITCRHYYKWHIMSYFR